MSKNQQNQIHRLQIWELSDMEYTMDMFNLFKVKKGLKLMTDKRQK